VLPEAIEDWGLQLAEAGFDAERPVLRPFWIAFRRWCSTYVQCRRDRVFITFGSDADSSYCEFCRDFDHEIDDQSFGITARFHSSRPEAPRLPHVGEQSDSQEGHVAAMDRLERHPAYIAAIECKEWEFEAYRE
jgi:hypothetical protein